MDFASEARIELSTLCNHPQLQRKKEVMSSSLLSHIMAEIQKQPSINQITLSGFGEVFTDGKVLDKIK